MIITDADVTAARSTRQEGTLGLPAIELINSDRRGRDLLDDAEWLRGAIERWELPRREPTRADLDSLRALRTLLGSLAERISATSAVGEDELRPLNAILEHTPVFVQLELNPEGGVVLDMRPRAERWSDLADREIAGSFAAMLRRDWPPRLRLCENEDCRVAFYDTSKNRRRRWCDTRTCGNRIRVRRHRARNA